MRNTWIICPSVGNNTPKGVLMPQVPDEFPNLIGKGDARTGFSPEEESAARPVVVGELAHTGEEG